jgi:hypothetical protein
VTRSKALVVLLVIVFAQAAYADFQVFNLGDRIGTNQRSDTQALCAFRDDVAHRKRSTENLLQRHPHGIPGISVATLQASIDSEKHTTKALSPLKCPSKT